MTWNVVEEVLMDCDENDLNDLANQYKFTLLQKKAFIKAVKILKNGSGDNNKQISTHQQTQFIHVYISPEEQTILNQINTLKQVFTDYCKENCKIKGKNIDQIKAEIIKLKNYSILIKNAFDNAMNELIQQCQDKLKKEERSYDQLNGKIYKKIEKCQRQFEQYLHNKHNKNPNAEYSDI